jgi:Zn-dependent protease
LFLFEPDRTPYDLNWRMFGVHVRVHPMFWLMACILGAYWAEIHAIYLLIWILCVFVSVLVHELGHVFMGRIFGSDGHIVLYSFGGVAIGSNDLRSRWKRIMVLFAGPLAGFVLYGVVYAIRLAVFPPREDGLPRMRWDMTVAELRLLTTLGMLLWINLAWGILNLLPIYPLDGGQISREVFSAAAPRNGLRASLIISLLLSGLLAVHCLMAANGRPLLPFLPLGGSMLNALLFGMLAMENYMMLQQVNEQQRRPWDHDSGW